MFLAFKELTLVINKRKTKQNYKRTSEVDDILRK